jgi:hypothetical protein
MAPRTPPPLDFDHKPGFEIATKHKEAIRQLHDFAWVFTRTIIDRYKLAKSIIRHILSYDKLERVRITRTSRLYLLNNRQIDDIIEYYTESWEYRILNFTKIYNELRLEYSIKTLERRLK